MNQSSKTTPVEKITIPPVTGSIWRNTAEKEGKPYYAVTVERSYRDENGNWKTAGSFAGSELLALAKVADLCHTRVLELRAADKSAAPSEEPQT